MRVDRDMSAATRGLGLASEWSRHSLVGDLRFGYSNYFDYESASRPDGSANVKARYDITRDTAVVFDCEIRFRHSESRVAKPYVQFGKQCRRRQQAFRSHDGKHARAAAKIQSSGSHAARFLRTGHVSRRVAVGWDDARSLEHRLQRLRRHSARVLRDQPGPQAVHRIQG